MITLIRHWLNKSTTSRAILSLLLLLTCQHAAARPLIIAHRAGLADAPENSILAIEKALKNGAEIIWLSVQLSKDGEAVVYRPDDLAEFTTGRGLISQHTAEQLAKLAYKNGTEGAKDSQKRKDNSPQTARDGHSATTGIPTLSQVLRRFSDAKFYLDLKSPDADPLLFAAAIDRTLSSHNSHHRVTVYSTNRDYSDAFKKFERIQRIAPRDVTREILLTNLLSHDCIAAARERGLHGFELQRDISAVEKFKLGSGTTKTVMKVDDRAATCILSVPGNKLILFGINNLEDYYKAVSYQAFAVMVDSPAFFKNQINQVVPMQRPAKATGTR